MIEISEILYRKEKGSKIKQIAKSLGYSKNTVKSVIKEASKLKANDQDCTDQLAFAITKLRKNNKNLKKESVFCKLNPYKSIIETWLNDPLMTVSQIRRLLSDRDVYVSDTSLRRYVKAIFPIVAKNYTIPLVSQPGQEAQVDYGYVGMMKNSLGKLRKTYAFVMTLSYSRYRYVEFVFSQDSKSWITSHINAFRFFGGVPKTVLLDNLKAGVIKADTYDPVVNRSYAEFERFYNFTVDPAKVRKPEHKGKVERSILIVKQQIIAVREYSSIDEANNKAYHWCREEIAKTVTRTTGKRPETLFLEEKNFLTSLPENQFDIAEWSKGKVHKDHHVVVKGNFYSVPTKYIGKEVSIRSGFNTVKIFYDHDLIKTHVKLQGKGLWSSDVMDYPKAVRKYLEVTPDECFKEALLIGEDVKTVVEKILEKPSKQKVRKVCALIRLSDKYGSIRVNMACKKAITFNNYEYKSIKSMLEKNVENLQPEPVPEIIFKRSSSYTRSAKYYVTEGHYG